MKKYALSEARLLKFALLAFVLAAPGLHSARAAEAGITPAAGLTSVGYVTTNGIGWSFTSTQDILVTGIYGSAPSVEFWQDSTQPLATFTYNGSGIIPPSASGDFQTITPLLLLGGHVYLVSCSDPQFSIIPVAVYAKNQAELKTFSVSPLLTGYAEYFLSPDNQWTSIATAGVTADNVNYFLLGPNFQFITATPEPSTVAMILLGIALLLPLRKYRFAAQ